MPNTPALVNEGASGLWAPEGTVSEYQKTMAFDVMSSFSKKAFWVEKEFLLDVVTGVSGDFLIVNPILAYNFGIY